MSRTIPSYRPYRRIYPFFCARFLYYVESGNDICYPNQSLILDRKEEVLDSDADDWSLPFPTYWVPSPGFRPTIGPEEENYNGWNDERELAQRLAEQLQEENWDI